MTDVEVATITFESGDGTLLEGDVLTPDDPRGSAVVCHPHPIYGGSRRDMVVAGVSRGLVAAGLRVLRFDFRGVGGSGGSHGGGPPEREDLLAAIDQTVIGDGPVLIAGYSFGADIALSVDHEAACGWLVVAPPLMVFPGAAPVAAMDPRPVHVIAGSDDEIASPGTISLATGDWVNTETTVIEEADHFFVGAAGRMADIATSVATGA